MRKRILEAWRAALLALCLLVSVPLSGTAAQRIYWHFTVKAFVHLPDTRAVEWAWVTMVEFDRARAFPSEARTAEQFGGELRGTVLAFVRGAAWRSSHSYQLDTVCHGKPAKKDIFWEESESDVVYAMGSLFSSVPFRSLPGTEPPPPDRFRFLFTNREVLREDGAWIDPKRETSVFTGAINISGQVREDTKGDFYVQGVNFRDNLEHHRRCGDAWVEQYLTGFRACTIIEEIPPVGGMIFGQSLNSPSSKFSFVWQIHRSRSRDHPLWKQQRME